MAVSNEKPQRMYWQNKHAVCTGQKYIFTVQWKYSFSDIVSLYMGSWIFTLMGVRKHDLKIHCTYKFILLEICDKY